MKLKQGFLLKEVAGDYIVVPVDDKFLDFGAVITLNDSGAFLWSCLTEDVSLDDLVSKLTLEYGVPNEQALSDIRDFIQILEEKGLIEQHE